MRAFSFEALRAGSVSDIVNVPEGMEALIAGDFARVVAAAPKAPATALTLVCRDDARMAALSRQLAFFAHDLEVLEFPAWDCQPYDRASPNPAIVARRMNALARLVRVKGREKPLVLLTTIPSILQRVPARSVVEALSLTAHPGNRLDMADIARWLELNGFMRTSTVRDMGDYAVRGGILDLFPPGFEQPVRMDFFGDTLESLRHFDPESQRTTQQMRGLELVPMSEVQLTSETMRKFRMGYVAAFGVPSREDVLYQSISEGRRYAGMEHWLPLFHDRLETLFDYLPGSVVMTEPLVDEAAGERLGQIREYYQARVDVMAQPHGPPYKPLPVEALYLEEKEWQDRLKSHALCRMSRFTLPHGWDAGGRKGYNFAVERANDYANLFDRVVTHIRELQAKKKVMVALWTEGARERMAHVLEDHGLTQMAPAASWTQALEQSKTILSLVLLGLEQGFETNDIALITEEDIFGDRLHRPRRKVKRAADFIAELTALNVNDLVVHADHGIGRFMGLKTITAAGAPHDCLELHYAGGDRLFLPVENIELLTRYGSEDTGVALDRLGGAGWQARKAKLRQRITQMAGELVKVAAERLLREAPRLVPEQGHYDEFAARFPYDETEDQQSAIEAVLEDLAAGKPMDRLICGDVGFGKTEVALRAAFASVMSGKQVAVVVPTTLLARQHFKTFSERFQSFPVKVAQASRMVSSADIAKTREGLKEGQIDIVVGTHALLGKNIHFKNLGLVIIDEEQHFGVAHKEKLKKLRAEVHVLTLSATPIPRTLQLAMTGVRDLSIMATPPVDRLAVRSFVMPMDPLVIREALLRERYRGGQAFYVCPRIEDLAERKEFLEAHVPEMRVTIAHGQMSATQLEEIMTAFYEGRFDILLSTTIVESGLDIPNANTLIVHRADMFGLSQLYQLRGRVGRAKARAYALFTIPADKPITPQSQKRLEVLQSLDTLGAGFQLASHDLDIRGAGNLLGDEQSGHIKEVGFELYQQMLEEAVEMLKAGISEPVSDRWSPQITVGVPVMIPEEYISDLAVRLGLYRRMADLDTEDEIRAMGAEMTDRFGKMPQEVKQLLDIMVIKALCRQANVEKVDAGPKGAVLSFRDNSFKAPDKLVELIRGEGILAKVRPDMKVVFIRDWPTAASRLSGVAKIMKRLVAIA